MNRLNGAVPYTVHRHNSREWLRVRWFDETLNPRQPPLAAGFYVVRVCPCHFGERVTRKPLETRGEAAHVIDMLLSVSDR